MRNGKERANVVYKKGGSSEGKQAPKSPTGKGDKHQKKMTSFS